MIRDNIKFDGAEAGLNNTKMNSDSLPDRSEDEQSVLAAKRFEFVTLTGAPSKQTLKENSKQVRGQVMLDFVRKQNRQAMTGIVEESKPVGMEEPAEYKSRFKLDSWTHKTKERNQKKSRTKLANSEIFSANSHSCTKASSATPTRDVRGFFGEQEAFQEVSNDLDPFDSLSIWLGPLSQKILMYYNTSYTMNSVAINAERNFFSFVKADPALFHAILYLVSLHHDLKRNLQDSSESLHHGGEAFSLLKRRLKNNHNLYSDSTIVAVALLVNKENLNGRYHLSIVHMRGLENMIRSRGGIHDLGAVFTRVVTWSDFCFANVWNCQPRFPRLPLKADKVTETKPDLLRASHLFGSQSPMFNIIHLLRKLSSDLDTDNISTVDILDASNNIYNLEYELLLLNKSRVEDPEPSSCTFYFEVMPLKLAAHLFLWLAIRKIPQTSELIYTLVQILQGSLELQIPGWWTSSLETRTWLLWILFMGGVASAGRSERTWFRGRLKSVCFQLDIMTKDGLRSCLAQVLWQDAFCADRCGSLWKVLESLVKCDKF